MKILHLPANVAGMPWALAEGQRRLGHDASLLSREQTRQGYPEGDVLNLSTKNRAARLSAVMSAFLRNVRTHDAYIFNYGQTLLHYPERGLDYLDLPFYPNSAKKIFLYQGCDARQKYPTMRRNEALGNEVAACFYKDCYNGACNSGERDKIRKRSIEKAEKFADHMYAVNPDLLYFLPPEKSTFLPYTMPAMISEDAKSSPFFEHDTVHIVHAPTDRGAKGTLQILQVLKQLEAEFEGAVRVTLVEHNTNEETLAIMRTADLFLDQVLIGWYGGAAVEAMNMGVPALAYINEEHLQFVPQDMIDEIPIISAHPGNLMDVLRRLIRDREQLPLLSPKMQAFARKWHDPMAVAEMMNPKIIGKALD